MDIEKLIHCLQCCSKVDAHNIGCDDCGLEYCGPECQQLCGTAATALSALQAENEKLRDELNDMKAKWDKYQPREHWETLNELCKNLYDELEQVKRERDAAVECINTVYSYILIKSKTDAVRTIEKWLRGQKED